ncbi:MAG: HAMP domain-containing histidine kinase [Anaerolineales bacterium]|nr:MAG: HAMP domain-containing histidine kinase [Anaerolineales bacterium]
MSIRLRLTLLYSAILAFTLIVFSIILFAIQTQFTLNMIEGDLKRIVSPVANRYPFIQEDSGHFNRPAPETAEGESIVLPRFSDQPVGEDEFRVRDFLHILDIDGNLVDNPMNQDATSYPINNGGLKILQSGGFWVEIVSVEEERLLVYNQAIIHMDSPIAIVQVARSLADRDRSMQALGITLSVGSALTTLVGVIGGWFLAGTTLKPVKQITQTANAIGHARDFSARVQYQGPEDEIGHLAMTFNEMLSQLEEGYQQVTHALQVQRDFVADVSHELRTPLTTIRGNLDLLKRDPPLPLADRDDILNDLSGESERMSRLVNDLLTLARADAGRTLVCESVNITAVIEDACRQMQVHAPDCEIIVGNTLTARAYANEDAVKQVVLILLDNAMKHAICPISLQMSEIGDQVSIRIQDSGPGMPYEQLKRIFDRFYQGDESRSSPGFGLGLAIARTLIIAQHGNLEANSEVGKGSTFIITLPKAP